MFVSLSIITHHTPNFLSETSSEEVFKIMKGLKDTKLARFNHFSVELIKSDSDQICSVLYHIINLSFKSGAFPNSLKKV